MDQWTLCSLLLLPLCFGSEETLVKTIGSEADVTPICRNETLDPVLFLVCKIRTEVSRGHGCRLLYGYGEDFVHGCDPRFTLMMENQTVFLHVMNLTPADSGAYTCECLRIGGRHVLHLNITVEADANISPSASATFPSFVVIGVTVFIIIIGVILGFICRRTRCGRSTTAASSARETAGSSNQDEPDDHYMSLQQPASDLYHTISYSAGNRTVCADNREMDKRDTSLEIYENM